MLAQNAGRSRLRPRKAALELTDAAVSRIKELLGKRHKVWSVCVTNCAGSLVVMGGGPNRVSLGNSTDRSARFCAGIPETRREDAGLQRHGLHPELRW